MGSDNRAWLEDDLYQGVEKMLGHMNEWHLDIRDFNDFDSLVDEMEEKVIDYRIEWPDDDIDVETWGWDFEDRIEMEKIFDYAKGFSNL